MRLPERSRIGLALVIGALAGGSLFAAPVGFAAATRTAVIAKGIPANLCDVKSVNKALSAFPKWRGAVCAGSAAGTRWTVGKIMDAVVEVYRSKKEINDEMGAFESDSNPASISIGTPVKWAAGYWDDQYGQGEMGIEINDDLYVQIQIQDPYLAVTASGIDFSSTGETPAPQLIGVGEAIVALN